jgi:protein-S-isoprenylcysteine O-methyltransferase Ste14
MSWSKSKLTLVSPFLMWAIVAAGIAFAVRCLPARHVFVAPLYLNTVLIPAVLNWLYFFSGGAKANKHAPRSAAAVDRLVTTGVYAKVRHPIYSADIFLAWGIFLCFPTLRVGVSVLWLTIVLLCWMKLEEAALLHKFGEDYYLYKAGTPMLFPRYFRRPNTD